MALRLGLLSTIILWQSIATASNGLSAIGHGAESIAMGGADLAVSRDTSALNINPAGLAHITGHELDLIGFIAHSDPIRHADSLGNDIDNSHDYIFAGTFGYAKRFSGTPLTAGIAVFGQGGTGVEYRDVDTVFGTTDSMQSMLRLARCNIGAGYQVDDRWSAGAALILTYGDNEQDFFPNTSVYSGDPATSFFGYHLEGLTAFGLGAKLGVQYRASERVTLAAGYTTKTSLEFTNGELVSNQSAIGNGKVKYGEVTAEGINLPRELGVGIAVQATPSLLWSAEINWLNWSDAIRRTTLDFSDPASATPVQSMSLSADQGWHDQLVYALGVAYRWSDDLTLRAGFNYAKQPIPESSLSPLLAPIGEQHYGLGFAWRLDDTWRLDFAYLLDARASRTYTNPNLPFGADAVTETRVHSCYLSLIRRW